MDLMPSRRGHLDTINIDMIKMDANKMDANKIDATIIFILNIIFMASMIKQYDFII